MKKFALKFTIFSLVLANFISKPAIASETQELMDHADSLRDLNIGTLFSGSNPASSAEYFCKTQNPNFQNLYLGRPGAEIGLGEGIPPLKQYNEIKIHDNCAPSGRGGYLYVYPGLGGEASFRIPASAFSGQPLIHVSVASTSSQFDGCMRAVLTCQLHY